MPYKFAANTTEDSFSLARAGSSRAPIVSAVYTVMVLVKRNGSEASGDNWIWGCRDDGVWSVDGVKFSWGTWHSVSRDSDAAFTPPAVGKWVWMTYVRKAAGHLFYIDDVLITDYGTGDILTGNTYDFDFGILPSWWNNTPNVTIGASKIWEAALTLEEIRVELNSVMPVRLKNLHSVLFPNDRARARVQDMSGKGNYADWNGSQAGAFDAAAPIRWRVSESLDWLKPVGGATYEEAITLAAQAGMSVNGLLDAVGGITLPAQAGISVQGILTIDDSISLAAIADITTQGGLVFDEAITLGAVADITGTVTLVLDESISLPAQASFQATGQLDAQALITLAANAAITAQGNLVIPVVITLPAEAAITAQGGFVINEIITLAAQAQIAFVSEIGLNIIFFTSVGLVVSQISGVTGLSPEIATPVNAVSEISGITMDAN